MKYLLHTLVLCALLLAATGCWRFSLEPLRRMDLEGKEFTRALAREYRTLAEKEAAAFDWSDAEFFARKALRAASGVPVDPEQPEDWRLDAQNMTTLKEARRTLLDTVTGKTILLAPEAAAHANALFDCWVEEQEEGWQEEAIATCKDDFFEMIHYLSTVASAAPVEAIRAAETVQPEPAKKPIRSKKKRKGKKSVDAPKAAATPSAGTSSYVIFFDFGSTKLNKDGYKTVKEVVGALKALASYEVVLHGHTDRSGNDATNLKLSKKRAGAVAAALVKRGVDKQRIQTFGFGGSDPAEADPKGKGNRRVEIFIQ